MLAREFVSPENRTCPPTGFFAKEMLAELPARTVARRQQIYPRGAMSTSLLLIREGLVKVDTGFDAGRGTLELLGPGDLVGEEALDGSLRRSSVSTVTGVVVHELPLALLHQLVTQDTSFVVALLAHLSRQVGLARELNSDMAASLTSVRLAHFVARLTTRIGIPAPEGVRVEHGLTQRELAGAVGSSRETVNKALRELVTTRLLEVGPGYVLVTNLPELIARGRVEPTRART